MRRPATPATLRPMSWRRSEEVQDEDTADYFLMLRTEAIAPAEGHNWHVQRRADVRRAVEVAGTLLGACSGVPVRAWRRIGMQVSPDSQPRHHWYLRSPILSAGQHSKQGDGPALIDDSVIERGSSHAYACDSPLGRWPGRQPCLALASTCGRR